MAIEIKNGTLDQFFASVQEETQALDRGEQLSIRQTIWLDPTDLAALLKPERTELIQYLRQQQCVPFSQLVKTLKRTPNSLKHDLALLQKYQLIAISSEPNPGHGLRKVIHFEGSRDPLIFRVEL